MGSEGRKGAIDITLAPDTGSLGSSQRLLFIMLSPPPPVPTLLSSSFGLAGIANFT